MTREEKIAALRKVAEGVPVREAFPPVVLVILENGPNKSPDVATIPKGRLRLVGIDSHDIEGIKEAFRQQNPTERLEITHLTKEENDAFDAGLMRISKGLNYA